MAQHNDYNIANQTASDARTDINNVLEAIATNNSGTSEPTGTTFPNQWFYHETDQLLKIRNNTTTTYLNVGYIHQTNGFEVLDDTQVVDTSGTPTGLLGNQLEATWTTGTGDTESLISPVKLKAAIEEHSVTSSSASEQGQMTFASGIKFVWGYFTSTSDGSQVFDFHSAFPNNCWNISMGGVRTRPGSFFGDQFAAIEIVSKTQFRANRDDSLNGTYEFYYFAIGN
jgi:hypothetical protein